MRLTEIQEEKARAVADKLGIELYRNDPIAHNVISAIRCGMGEIEALCFGLKAACEIRQKLMDAELERLRGAPRTQFIISGDWRNGK
jgi:hypothetical protein